MKNKITTMRKKILIQTEFKRFKYNLIITIINYYTINCTVNDQIIMITINNGNKFSFRRISEGQNNFFFFLITTICEKLKLFRHRREFYKQFVRHIKPTEIYNNSSSRISSVDPRDQLIGPLENSPSLPLSRLFTFSASRRPSHGQHAAARLNLFFRNRRKKKFDKFFFFTSKTSVTSLH